MIASAAGGFIIVVATCAPSQNWIQTPAPTTNWSSIASSADGSKLVAGVGGYQTGRLYCWHAPPHLNIASSGNNIVISWPASASGLILQQSHVWSATNWADVTDSVRFLNGENQVVVSASGNNGFYRLRSP